MNGSLSAAVSGIDANQQYLDVIANNIANANTVGYKQKSVQFADLLGAVVNGGTAPGVSGGGVNPQTIGDGVVVSGISTDFSQGSDQATGSATDIEINGDGFLVVQQNGQDFYTRNGNLTLDANGNLTTSTGAIVQGWMAQNGVVSAGGGTGALTITPGQTSSPQATQNVFVSGNLDPDSGVAQTLTTTAYDSAGKAVPVQLVFTPSGNNDGVWKVAAYANGDTTTNLLPADTEVAFGSDGQLTSVAGADVSTLTATKVNGNSYYQLTAATLPNGLSSLSFDLPATTSAQRLTSVAGNETAEIVGQDGFSAGTLQSFSIGADGRVTGTYSNGRSQVIGQIALAQFANDGGLIDRGNSLYTAGPNSGTPQIGIPGVGGRGSLIGGHLEGSNVDLGDQLTALIVAQSAYQANTKVVSTTAAVLQSLNQMT